jgi:integrase
MTERGKVSGPYRLESGAWQIRWRDPNAPPGKNQRKASYPSQKLAVRKKKLLEADLLRDTYIDMGNKITVAEYAWQWITARPLRPRSEESYASFIHNHVEPVPLGARPMVKVRPSEIQAWVTSRAKPRGPLGPITVANFVGILRSIFAAAVLDGLIARNPVLPGRHLKLPQVDRPRIVPLTIKQVVAWAAAMPERFRAMVVVQGGLGLRVSELLALRVQDVDFLKREVRIEEQLAVNTLERVPLKTKYSRRTIPAPPVVLNTLAEQIRRFPPAEDGGVWTNGPGGPKGGPRPPSNRRCSFEGCPWEHYAGGWCEGHWRQSRRHGEPLAPVARRGPREPRPLCKVDGCPDPVRAHGLCDTHRQRVRRRGTIDEPPSTSPKERVSHQQYARALSTAARKFGLPAGTTSHDLRHHYASVLLHQGVSAHAVAERLGHADPTLVNTTYGHVMPDSEDRTRQAIQAAWDAASQQAAAEDDAG